MTALHMIWLSSGAGAAIFFALGYVVRVLARSSDQPDAAVGGTGALSGDGDELSRLRIELATGDRQRAELSKELEARTREAREAGNRVAQLRDSLSESEATRARVERQPVIPAGAGGDGDVDTAVAPAPRPVGGVEASAGQEETTKTDTRAAELVAAVDERVYLKDHAEEADKKRADAERACAKAETEVEALTRKLANAERAIEREQQRRTKSDKERLEAKTELATLRAETSAIEETREKLAQNIAVSKSSRGNVDALREDNARLRIEVDRLSEARDKLAATREARDKAEAELRKVETEAHTLRADAERAAAIEKKLAALERQNNELRRGGHRADSSDEALSRARQTIKALEREIGELKASAAGEPVDTEKAALAEEVEDLERRAADAERLAERVSTLEAQLFAAGIEPKEDKKEEPAQGGDRLSYVGLDVALSSLAAVANLRAAVVADDMGLVIAGAGKTEYHEDVAALSGLARHMADRAQDLLPLDDIEQITLEDTNHVVLTCRLFASGTDAFALSMLGTKASPPHELIDKHVRSLLKTLA